MTGSLEFIRTAHSVLPPKFQARFADTGITASQSGFLTNNGQSCFSGDERSGGNDKAKENWFRRLRRGPDAVDCSSGR